MEKEPRPTNLKKPSVYPRYKSTRWICDFDEIADGKVKNRRPSFKTKKDAEKKLKEIEAKQRRAIRKSEGSTLTAAQVLQAQWLFSELERLPWRGITPVDLVEHFKRTYRDRGSTPLLEALAEFENYKKGSGIKPSTFKDIPPRLSRIAKSFEGRMVADVTAADLIAFVDEQRIGMRHKYYALVREFIDYASHEGREGAVFHRKLVAQFEFETKNGKRYKLKSNTAPTVLHVDEIKAALASLIDFKVKDGVPGEWLGYFVLGTFCGLRPHEIQALARIQRGEWGLPGKPELYQDYGKLGKDSVWKKHIQLRKGLIVCDDMIGTKTNERRNVQIQPNVLEWLKLVRDRGLPLCPGPRRFARYGKFFRIEVMDEKRQRDKKWDDVFRHTFATFLHSKEGMTESEYSRQLGHSMDVARKSYLGDMYDSESSEQFFSIRPDDVL